MANLIAQSIGGLDLYIKQGNTQNFKLSFDNVLPNGTLEPIDLTQYTSIKMDVKSKVDVNVVAFISWSVGNGLIIEGTDNNILSFTFGEEFLASQATEWVYDTLFTEDTNKETLVGGKIYIKRVVTK